jgi:uncharacterized protein YbaP (TraB family)
LSAPRPREWIRTAYFVALIALLVLAAGFAAVGVVARVDASHHRSRAEPVARALRAEVEKNRRNVATLATLRRRARGLGSASSALMAAIRAQVDSANHAVAVMNQSSDLYNSGDVAGATTALENDGDAAVNDLDDTTRTVRESVTRVQQDSAALAETSRG